MKRNKIFLPHIRYIGSDLYGSLEQANGAGYGGVEIHLVSFRQNERSFDRVKVCMEEARRLGLRIHLHQGWSFEESGESRWAPNSSTLLQWFGYLARFPYHIDDHVPPNAGVPVVAYPDRWREVLGRGNYWFQTAPIWSGSGGSVSLDYGEFLDLVKKHQLPVVFDTWHFLEYSLGIKGVKDLPRSRDSLLRFLEDGWRILGPHVEEIHFNDSHPDIGRNVFPGKGIIPLWEFARLVKDSGWSGSIVPEVFPKHLGWRPWSGVSTRRLIKLRETVEGYFA